MAHYFPEEALNHHRKFNHNSLQGVVALFPVQLKKALYAVSDKGTAKRATWADCAFKQAGDVVGKKVYTTSLAAKAFDVSEDIVSRFISRWDSLTMSDKNRANLLKDALLAVGLTTPPGEHLTSRLYQEVMVMSETVFKSEQTKFIEELESVETIADIPGLTEDEVNAVIELMSESENRDDKAQVDVSV